MRKKIIRTFRKTPTLFIVACLAAVLFISSATLAWFAATDAKENEFNTNFQFKVNLVDEFDPVPEIFPEQLIDKKVTVKNTGDLDGFVRVMVFPVIVDQETTPLDISQDVEVILNKLNTLVWLDGGDGYFYYLNKLAPGEEAPLLFESVTLELSKEQVAVYDGARFDIEVKSEAIDARKNEYRYAWWGISTETSPTLPLLQQVDDSLQASLRE